VSKSPLHEALRDHLQDGYIQSRAEHGMIAEARLALFQISATLFL
jgi:hypothetical protein